MADSVKRKEAPGGGAGQPRPKKKKTGNAGKWKTPHQLAKIAALEYNTVNPGDQGVWVTCARQREVKASREIQILFAEYAEKLYGIKSVLDSSPPKKDDAAKKDNGDDSDSEPSDIEAAIKKEVAALTSKPDPSSDSSQKDSQANTANRMVPIRLNVDCLLFVKTQPPVNPVEFVKRICEDAAKLSASTESNGCGDAAVSKNPETKTMFRCRYVNRLTPVSATGKATEQGLIEVARKVLEEWFDLSGKRGQQQQKGEGKDKKEGPEQAEKNDDAGAQEGEQQQVGKKPYTFAIRPTIRNHSTLTRDVIINTVAGLINDERHKVNLKAPDKVILIDIYQNVCGMSVVDGDWEALRKYNLTELYGVRPEKKEKEQKAGGA